MNGLRSFTITAATMCMLHNAESANSVHADYVIGNSPDQSTQLVRTFRMGNVPDLIARELVLQADRSTCTTSPTTTNCDGLISPGDRVVVTEKYLLWLDLTPEPALQSPNGGGGFLRGIWTITDEEGPDYEFLRPENVTDWAPNELLPGSTIKANGTWIQGSGVALNIRLRDNEDLLGVNTMSAEITTNFSITLDGTDVPGEDAIHFQTQGWMAHTKDDIGFLINPNASPPHHYENQFDANANPGVQAYIRYTLTYVFDNGHNFRQVINLDSFGPDLVTYAPSDPIGTYNTSACGVANGNGFGLDVSVADRNREIINQGAPGVDIPAFVPVSHDLSAIPNQGLFLDRTRFGLPDPTLPETWQLTDGSISSIYDRQLTVSVVDDSPYLKPDFGLALLNGSIEQGVGIACIDLEYIDENKGSVFQPIQPGGHVAAIDYSTREIPYAYLVPGFSVE